MKPQETLEELRRVQKKYKDARTNTFEVRITDMAKDAADTIDLLINQVKFLWGLLDDIDTVGDMAKSNDKAYRSLVEKIHLKRQHVAESDGYEIFVKNYVEPVKNAIISTVLKEKEISTAIDILRTEFQKDQSNGSYYDSWVSNLACCIMDQYSDEEKDHFKANNAAKAFINLLMMDNGELIIEGLKEGIKESPEFMRDSLIAIFTNK